jgi:N-hydroxyarylamine O-acetyltransferase
MAGCHAAGVIDRELAEAVYARLGLADRPPPTSDGLDALYLAWCRHVPFDNLVKRIHLVTGSPAPLPNGPPAVFFDLFLRHGTGGTCWPGTLGLHALLLDAGFDARLGSASMRDDVLGRQHTHACNLVQLDGHDWWLDTAMLTEQPIPIAPGGPSRLDHPVRPVRVEPVDGLWRVRWWRQQFPEELSCLLLDADATFDHCLVRYEASREKGIFNDTLTAITSRPGGTLLVAFGQRCEQDADGFRHEPIPDRAARDRILVEEFGYSEEIVARVPPDDES